MESTLNRSTKALFYKQTSTILNEPETKNLTLKKTQKLTKLLKKSLFAFTILIFIVGEIIYHDVPTAVTQEDAFYIKQLMQQLDIKPLKTDRTFDEEISFIREVQEKIIKKFSTNIYNVGIPLNSEREIKNLINSESNLCFDRSRAIEKIFKFSNFKTTHLSLFKDTVSNKSDFFILFEKKEIKSHAVSEVKTKNGWLALDSNIDFIALDTFGKVYSYSEIRENYLKGLVPKWQTNYSQDYEKFWVGSSLGVYGLYSRHGRFYPPYDFIPDYNLNEMFYNFRKSKTKV